MEVADLSSEVEAILALPADQRVGPLTALAKRVPDGASDPVVVRLATALAGLIEEGAGSQHERVEAGVALGRIGDPRLKAPTDADYFVQIDTEDGPLLVGRFPVTNAEYKAFVDAGGYEKREYWSDAGWAWLQESADPWPESARREVAAPYVVANQPVVGVTSFEAEAYAAFASARLPKFDERLRAVRGAEKRPYPWGSPFGEGNANTREEVVGRPCAVGLYLRDRTPEGLRDLAGNVAEWAADGPDGARWYSPGAWDQPSMAAWAKAREMERPEARWAGLGFRLVRDVK